MPGPQDLFGPYKTHDEMKSRVMITGSKPMVSVVVPTYNSERTVDRCLISIANQTYDNVETIVVDKFSRDDTTRIAHSFGAKVFRIEAEERSEQMNFGVEAASGEYIYIVGSDFVLEPTVIEEAVERCHWQGYDAVCVHNTSDQTVGFWSRVRKFERDMYKDDDFNVAARFLRKTVFKKVDGFDPQIVAAEDYDFQNRLLRMGFRVGRINAKEIHIGEPKTLREIARKHYYYGKTLRAFVKKNRGRGVRQLAPIRPAFLRHWKDFLEDPSLSAGLAIYQLVRYLSAGIGYLVGKV